MSLAAELHNAHKARLAAIAEKAAELNRSKQPVFKDAAPKTVEKIMPAHTSAADKIEQLERRIEELQEALDRHGEILAKMCRDSLSDTPRFTEIVETVSQFYGVSLVALTSPRRSMVITRPRQVVYYLARKLTGLSLPQIGYRLGKRDHTTVMHGIEKITKDMKRDELLRDDVDLLELKVAEKVLNRETPRGQQVVHKLPVCDEVPA
jgi:chromosomal replication initiator protein